MTDRHSKTRAIVIWLCSLLAVVALVAICYLWLDRPIALLVHSEVQRTPFGWWKMLSRIPNPLIPLAVLVFVGVGLHAFIKRSLPRYQIAALVSSLSVLITEATKDQLKFLFGRAWPESWQGNNPSFIRDGVYGFHFMQGGGIYNSFPSGHTATACGVLAVLWAWYPRWRTLWLSGGAAVAGGLVALNYHFLGDVIAGAFLGVSVGWGVSAYWHSALPKLIPKDYNR